MPLIWGNSHENGQLWNGAIKWKHWWDSQTAVPFTGSRSASGQAQLFAAKILTLVLLDQPPDHKLAVQEL